MAGGRSSAMSPRPTASPAAPCIQTPGGRRLEAGQPLRQEAGDDAGEHVAASRGGEIRRRVGVDGGAAIRRRDHRVVALQHHHRAALLRRSAGAVETRALNREEAAELAFMRCHARQAASVFLMLAKSFSGLSRPAGQRIGIEDHGRRRLPARPPHWRGSRRRRRCRGRPAPTSGAGSARSSASRRRTVAFAHHDGGELASVDQHRIRRRGHRDGTGAGAQRRGGRKPRRAGGARRPRDHEGMAAGSICGRPGRRRPHVAAPERRQILKRRRPDLAKHAVGNADVGDFRPAAQKPARQQQVSGLEAEEGHGPRGLHGGALRRPGAAIDPARQIDGEDRRAGGVQRAPQDRRHRPASGRASPAPKSASISKAAARSVVSSSGSSGPS